MKTLTHTATVALAALVCAALAVAFLPVVASLGLVAFGVVAAVLWMSAVHAMLAGRDDDRRRHLPALADRGRSDRHR